MIACLNSAGTCDDVRDAFIITVLKRGMSVNKRLPNTRKQYTHYTYLLTKSSASLER